MLAFFYKLFIHGGMFMKTWNKPIIEELDINKTARGSAIQINPDYTFRAQDGHLYHSFSGTGMNTDNRKDIVEPINP
jgi:hypothetical protein